MEPGPSSDTMPDIEGLRGSGRSPRAPGGLHRTLEVSPFGGHMRTKSNLLLPGIVFATMCFGQLDRGTITGTVTDSSGGVVPGAQIAIRNKATNATYESKTTRTGDYTAVNLPAGMYDVTFSASGLKTLVRSDIVVAVSETFRADAVL